MTGVAIGNRTLISNVYSEGYLLNENYGNGSTKEYSYDEGGNLISQVEDGIIAYEWTYDIAGNITTYSDCYENVVYSYSYDEEGNLLSVNADNGFGISYNQTDDVYSVTYENGDVVKTQSTVYDKGQESETDEFIPTSSTTCLISGGKLISVTSSENTEEKTICSNENVILSSLYTYNENGIDKIEYQDGKVLQYTYDNNGNITSILENGEETASYEYDGLGQLIRENSAYANKTIVYTYDNAGNILKTSEYSYTTDTLGKFG